MNFVDHEELADRSRRQRRKQKRDLVWNVLTGIAVLATITLIGMLMLIFSNPRIGLNPFPPPTMPVLVDLSTPTATLVFLPPTWTPTARLPESSTIAATSTPKPFATETQVPPTFAPTLGDGVYPFELESDPIAMASTVFHTDGNCSWQGVAGRVVDMKGSPQPNIRVHLKGVYNGKTIDLTTITGLAAEWYGPSGFEFKLSEKAIDSTALLAIQLEDQSFLPISEQVILEYLRRLHQEPDPGQLQTGALDPTD